MDRTETFDRMAGGLPVPTPRDYRGWIRTINARRRAEGRTRRGRL